MYVSDWLMFCDILPRKSAKDREEDGTVVI